MIFTAVMRMMTMMMMTMIVKLIDILIMSKG